MMCMSFIRPPGRCAERADGVVDRHTASGRRANIGTKTATSRRGCSSLGEKLRAGHSLDLGSYPATATWYHCPICLLFRGLFAVHLNHCRSLPRVDAASYMAASRVRLRNLLPVVYKRFACPLTPLMPLVSTFRAAAENAE